MILQISMIKYEKRTVERADEISYLLFQVNKFGQLIDASFRPIFST